MYDDIFKMDRISIKDYDNYIDNNILVEHVTHTGRFKQHWHDHYEIEYIVGGSGYHLFNGIRYEVLPGAIHILTPSDFHELIATDTIELIKIYYEENNVDSYILSTLSGLSNNAPIYVNEHKDVFDTLFSLIVKESEFLKDSPNYSITMKKNLESLLLNIIEYLKKINSSNKEAIIEPKSDIH